MGGQAKQVRGLVLGSGVATTLVIWVPLMDPVQLPKMFLGGILAFWILGLLLSGFISSKEKKLSLGQWSVMSFAVGLLIAGAFTDVRYRALFGTFGRFSGGFFYLILAILCFAAMSSFNSNSVPRFRLILIILGSLMSFHGILENTGHEPFNWSYLYSPLVGTVGNPDFYSGLMGACAVAVAWFVLMTRKNSLRALATLLMVVQFYLIYKTHSVQGLVAFAVGISLLAITRLWQWKKQFGISAAVLSGVAGLFAVLGILNIGPLSSFLAKGSVNSRFDYWRAAFGMFKSHPIVGVGLDRFGEYYGQYSPQIQTVQGQMTDNAHNVFLQLLATGGLVLFIPYLFLLIVIGWTGFRAILRNKGVNQMTLMGVFSIWFSFLAISSVSIDNLGSTCWFWITGGLLYAISNPTVEEGSKHGKSEVKIKQTGRKAASKQELSYLAPVISLTLSLFFLLVTLPVIKSFSALAQLSGNRQSLDAAQYVEKAKTDVLIQPSNIDTLGQVASLVGGLPNYDLAIELSKSLNEKDPRSFYGNMVSAISYEKKSEFIEAIPFRIRLMEIDKWNTISMVELVKDYVAVADMANARLIATKISRLYPGSDAAKTAAGLVNA